MIQSNHNLNYDEHDEHREPRAAHADRHAADQGDAHRAQPARQPHDAIVLAADAAGRALGAQLLQRCETEWPLLVVEHAGQALRHAWRFDPRALFVCIGTEQIDVALDVIRELRARVQRPDRALVALADRYDQAVERSVRIAGAAYYFALDAMCGVGAMRDAVAELGVSQTVATPHSGLSPPLQTQLPAKPPPQSRASPPRDVPRRKPRSTAR